MPGLSVAASRPEDRDAIGEITRRAGVFTEEERESVFELFDAHLQSDDSGYEWLSARREGRVVGYACYGPASFAQGAYDLYWICSDPEARGGGVGRNLIAAMEADIRARGGRLLMVWTSGAAKYRPAAKFYKAMGCQLSARIRDYYQPGEDLVVYVKHF
ncbi:MAG: GNAT family N-acetyltransferase [Anaerolineales bacterium]|nr:GNAT family N-acetyltransferase [Anaerolineales bacterium]